MIRVVIADDHPLMRQGIRHLLEGQADMQVVGEAGDGEEAVRLVTEARPDVVLMDVAMPRVDGLEATRQIRAKNPESRVVVLTIHDEQEYVEGLLKAGAAGYLLKGTGGPSLLEAVRLASLGEMVLDSTVGNELVRKDPPGASKEKGIDAEPALEQLTEKQVQLLKGIAKGMTNAQIARQLKVSERTVKGYATRLFDKLGVSSRTAAVTAAIRLGILRSEEL